MPFLISPQAQPLALCCCLGFSLLYTPQIRAQQPPPEAPATSKTTEPTETPTFPSPELPHAEVPPAKVPLPLKTPPQVLADEPLRAIAARLKKPLPLQDGRVVVLKSQRTLQLFDGQTLLKTYKVSLGPRPSGHKQQRGDGRTPEGEYFICTRNSKTSAFHIFLGLSYPALPDATRGAQSKLISPREMQVIRSRLASRSAPPWNTKLGGWVGIHGGSDAPFASRVKSKRQSLDWTAGCVAVSNKEIEEISAALKVGARVSIRP
jgi:hypothetical protein